MTGTETTSRTYFTTENGVVVGHSYEYFEQDSFVESADDELCPLVPGRAYRVESCAEDGPNLQGKIMCRVWAYHWPIETKYLKQHKKASLV